MEIVSSTNLQLKNIKAHIKLFFCRRKKSIQRNQIVEDIDKICQESQLKPAPFIPELRDSFECEKQDKGITRSDSREEDERLPDDKSDDNQLVKPSDIRAFVRTNSRHKIEMR